MALHPAVALSDKNLAASPDAHQIDIRFAYQFLENFVKEKISKLGGEGQKLYKYLNLQSLHTYNYSIFKTNKTR